MNQMNNWTQYFFTIYKNLRSKTEGKKTKKQKKIKDKRRWKNRGEEDKRANNTSLTPIYTEI